MQQVIAAFGDEYRFLDLPDPDEQVMPGVQWGRHEHPLTAAFWVSQAWMSDNVVKEGFHLGSTLAEEVTACLLGGHGAPAEVGLAAFGRVRDELNARACNTLPVEVLEKLLQEPLIVNSRPIRYRFARQRAKYLAGALEGVRTIDETALGDVAFREVLCRLPGVGPKTASWIVRNRRASDEVAILDIHILRACSHMGVFPAHADPARHYRDLERRFLAFCHHTGSRASVLDAVMWGTMRRVSHGLMRFLVDGAAPPVDNPRKRKAGGGKCLAAVVSGATTGPETRAAGRRRAAAAGLEEADLLQMIPA